MEFKYGDRVRMLMHADWKRDAVGTIISIRTRIVNAARWLDRRLVLG